MGDITLSPEEIERLFAIYFEQFHSYFPILDPEKTPTQYYDASKSLFWSIISVALRSYKQELLDDVGSVLSTLVWTETGSPQKNLAGELRYFVVIQKSSNEAFQALAQLNDNPALIGQEASFFARMVHYEKVLTDIDALYGIEMSLLNRIRSQGSILYLQLLYLLSNSDLEETKKGILRAYRTSTTLIQDLIAEETISTFLAGAPFTVLRLLLRAAFTIAKVWFSELGNHIDRTSGKILYDASALLVRQMSHLKTKSDRANRAGTAMNMIWKHMAKKPDLMRQPPSLRIRSRMGASLQYDCLMHYRDAAQEVAGQAETASLSDIGDKSNAATMRPNHTDINHEQSSLPSYEAFLDTDLSWLDDLVNPLT
ncbi:Regulatory protein leu3 [Lithohypha guttulata]|uniref:Regulatory protein leu3 n=1 Tax=Lithohypha guttulata TaxID=1690604 RepID=UPI002DDFDE13|nr:Regulatory protein leu3 [Lithohypha guttulata]